MLRFVLAVVLLLLVVGCAQKPPETRYVIQGPNPVTFSIRQDKGLDTSRMTKCPRFRKSGEKFTFEYPDPGKPPFQITFSFEDIKKGKATIPILGDVYPDQYIFMDWKGTERVLFYVKSIHPEGVETIVLNPSSCETTIITVTPTGGQN